MVRTLRSIPCARLRLLVFDLDGTLIDSRKDLVESVNAALSQFGLAPQDEDRIASYIGDGAGMLVKRALEADGADLALAPAALDAFLAHYREHKLDHTTVYPGVLAQLSALQAGLPVQMAVLTNKPVRPSQEICEALQLAPFFFSIYGGNSFATKKPGPEGLLKLMAEAGATPEETVMIGDSEVDIRTAKAAGTWSLGCRFGLSPHTIADMEQQQLVDVVVDHASEWTEALGVTTATAERSRGL
ncbi:HAD-IA family hydrolase [Acidipila sp. EB88]|uniref:HAD-IA family hydrolase n=1 Tax=Acidipila sp. EB88 TaxID=2305226 RepID=UPI000F5D57D8|nr:HAD-IA family hydrolase [Acidipila sp. EB88]RRA49078.1 HAD family hydrolase [Acidipila sp. EB88]